MPYIAIPFAERKDVSPEFQLLIRAFHTAQSTGAATLPRAVHYFCKEQIPHGIPRQLPVHPRT